MSVVIRPQDLAGKPKEMGTLNGDTVLGISTIGGWAMIVCKKSGTGGFETLGAAPHMAVARAVAMKMHPKLQLNELSKSEWVPYEAYSDLMDQYLDATKRIRALQGIKE